MKQITTHQDKQTIIHMTKNKIETIHIENGKLVHAYGIGIAKAYK